jgi:hypothetical protein
LLQAVRGSVSTIEGRATMFLSQAVSFGSLPRMR